MKRGSSIVVFALGFWLAPAWAVESVNPPPSPGRDPARAATASEVAPKPTESTREVLKRETYYHFFLQDYLTAATRLKLLEGSVPHDADALNHIRLLRGSLYVAWGMHRPATVIFDELVYAFPPGHDRNQVLFLIERLQYARSLYQAALSTYERLTPDPTFASLDHAAYLAGMSHYALGNFDQALGVMAAIPGSSSYVPFARLAAAKSYARLAKVDDASRLLGELGAMETGEDTLLQALAEKSRLTLGLLLTEAGRYDEALGVFASVPRTSPFYPDAVFGSGWAWLYQERYSQSLAAFQTLIHSAPTHPYALEALTTIGHCYDRLGARTEALHAYGKALSAYRREQQTLDAMRAIINNRDRLSGLLADFSRVLDSPLGPLLDDDGLRFWMKQYSELGSVDQYLARKLDDIAVFEVMVEHREAVFRDRLPIIRQFVKQTQATPLRERQRQLQVILDRAVHHETPEAWAAGTEAAAFDALTRARRKSRAVGTAIGQLDARVPVLREQRDALHDQWRSADRWLDVLQGEQVWTILTQVPGRRDDLQRAMRQIDAELGLADENQRVLIDSIGGLQDEITQFRERIQTIRRALVAQRAQVTELRSQLLPPLQALLLKTVDQRSGQMEAMAAAARLSQVHIMDVMSQ